MTRREDAGKNGSRGRSPSPGGSVVPGLVFILLACAPSAHAHILNTGFGAFYDGMVHFFYAPDDLLGAVAIGLLAGLAGAPQGCFVPFVLPLAWLAGGFLGALWGWPETADVATAVGTIVTGALVALDLKLPAIAPTVLAALFGLFHGYMNCVVITDFDILVAALSGILLSLIFTIFVVTGRAITLRAGWTRIVVRVMGSWIAAVGLLMLGWAFRPVPAGLP